MRVVRIIDTVCLSLRNVSRRELALSNPDMSDCLPPYKCNPERTNVAVSGVSNVAPTYTAPVSGVGKRGSGSGPVLEVQNLSKTFGDVKAVNDLTFAVGQGEVLGFLGPNGAGKSTTVGMILGLVRPTAGSVRVNGVDVQGNQHVVSESVGAII